MGRKKKQQNIPKDKKKETHHFPAPTNNLILNPRDYVELQPFHIELHQWNLYG